MTFPQFFDGNELQLNIVVLPRDHNPLNPIIVGEEPQIPDAGVAFADAQFSFGAQLIQGFGANPLPQPKPLNEAISLSTVAPDDLRGIFEAMAKHLQIFNPGMVNSNANLQNIPLERQFEAARPAAFTVFKHLPKSYFEATGQRAPRTPNAVTGDRYHCAVKAAKFHPGFQKSSDIISWGKVFAHILRQPLLARAAGFIYSTTLAIDENTFPEGGFLYIDLAAGSSFSPQQEADDTFIKRYAARIPALKPGEPRQVFAPLLYPVLNSHDGNYDKLFIETAEYDDGFAKIVHCHQAPHRDPLVEEADGSYPVKDTGVRLGWDDEQILIWYMRQLMTDSSVANPGKRLDAPIGVFGYIIDVRETANEGEPENSWESLNQVISKQPISLPRDPAAPGDFIGLGDFQGELPYQVYPVQLDGAEQVTGQPQPYWLPMYFANWNGHSMVLPDEDAAAVYQTANPNVDADPDSQPATDKDGNLVTTGTGVTGGAKNNLNQVYNPGPVAARLRYGRNYQFRVRMQDVSGGTPGIDQKPVNETPTDIASCQFKRFIAPIQPRIQEIEAIPTAAPGELHPVIGTDGPSALNELNVKRPKLGYPAVVYTGKYQDPIQRLVDQSNLSLDKDDADHSHNAEHRVGLGIADPDVSHLEIAVEIETLKLDKLDSLNGKDDFVHLYTTRRFFPPVNGNDDNYEATLNIPIEYKDVQGPDKVLNTGAELNLVQDLGLGDDIDNLSRLVLPTARTIRLTIRAVCEDKASENETSAYYGVVNNTDKLLDVRYGESFTVMLYHPSEDETGLLVQTAGVPELQGIFMRPDAETVFDGKLTTLFFGMEQVVQNSNVQQLAGQLNLESSGLTLNAAKGKRVVFGCSSRIRHTLAPDGSSVTFASKSDLYNHWLCCISLEIDRDWMWDALETNGFTIKRTRGYTHDEQPLEEEAEIGRIKMVRTASFESLDNPQRNSTRIVFIDAVEPKKDDPQGGNPAFPDTINVSYRIDARFKADHAIQKDDPKVLEMTLPITSTPAQVPVIVSAGLALSPYVRDEKYANSESRRRFLWIEFEKPIEDPQDTYFARVLANAPDQLISNNDPSLFVAPEEPPLPLDPEQIRIITQASSNDLAGLSAMQPMIKSASSDVHYILPLPPGLHANSDEMFGFFTYEFRVGHFQRPPAAAGQEPEKVWTTAQGRFGRRLKSQGIQHPAPALACMPDRDGDKLWVTAPYAVAVHDGKNVTAKPPRTELWALLYAQVKQADNMDYRNILLDDRPLDWRIQVAADKEAGIHENYSEEQLALLQQVTLKTAKGQASLLQAGNFLKLTDFAKKNKSAAKYGTTVWNNKEVSQLLAAFGLPKEASLSVLVVETLPQITNIFEHMTDLGQTRVARSAVNLMSDEQKVAFSREYGKRFGQRGESRTAEIIRGPSPVSDALGHYRILRTSRLTKVPDVCCTGC
ncbi:hypothetical protein EDD80_11640 [Anseongella ginsenosidimutans]|uniref:Uncharacterized protein n=2 Tax=Anseongella ginsenosidimutans TaxID=496056 RepID=A0A4R3KMF4_9SPHI|nr:hypothetical protein EDD80_11640 [Anseongella ginsenosidimutans]